LVDDHPDNLVDLVFTVLRGACKSREVLEAELPEELRGEAGERLVFDNWACTIERTGLLLAYLSAVPPTRARLMGEMRGLVDRAPAWLEASVEGKPMTYELFVRGLEQTIAVQRRAFEQVVGEQVIDPEPIEEMLAEAPVPDSATEPPRSIPMAAVGKVATAHMEALVEIAFDIEDRIRAGRTDFPS
jgi:hypothetical protein